MYPWSCQLVGLYRVPNRQRSYYDLDIYSYRIRLRVMSIPPDNAHNTGAQREGPAVLCALCRRRVAREPLEKGIEFILLDFVFSPTLPLLLHTLCYKHLVYTECIVHSCDLLRIYSIGFATFWIISQHHRGWPNRQRRISRRHSA